MALLFIRTVIIYLVITVFMRMMGKRQLRELEPSEFVVAVLISNVASAPLQDSSIPLLEPLASVGVLVACEVLLSALLLKSIRLRALVCGKPSLLISNGAINQTEMRKNRYTIDELLEELRKLGITDLATVREAVLETDGTLSAILFAKDAPLTPAQAGIAVDDEPYPVIVINQGRVLTNNLTIVGRNEQWLRKTLAGNGLDSPRSAYLMTCDRNGKTVVIPAEKEVRK